MSRQLWLVKVLRDAGLKVIEVDGWETRGSADYAPEGLIAHDTGSSSVNTTDAGEIRVMIEGRPDLPPPIAQVYLSRTGTWHVVTSGQSNHVRTGWAGPFRGLGNHRLLGIEAQHADGEPWAPTQYDSYVRGVAAILAHTGWPTVAGHKEHQPGAKVDPSFNMDRFRRDVAAAMNGDDMSAATEKQISDLHYAAFRDAGTGRPAASVTGTLASLTAGQPVMLSTLAGLTKTVQLLAEAIRTGGGSLDTAAVLARIDERAQEDTARDEATAAEIAQLHTELAAYRAAEAAAARAGAEALEAGQ